MLKGEKTLYNIRNKLINNYEIRYSEYPNVYHQRYTKERGLSRTSKVNLTKNDTILDLDKTIPIPEHILEKLDWNLGDQLRLNIEEDNFLLIGKVLDQIDVLDKIQSIVKNFNESEKNL